MRKLLLLTICYVFIGRVYAQELIRIPMTDRMQDDKIRRSLAILPVYQFTSPEIEPFSFFGIDEKKKGEQKPLTISKMPDMTGMRDTGYTYIYFSGANNDINQGYCLTLIGNFKRSRKTVYFFVDRNNNLDFTDDGIPDSLSYRQDSVVIRLPNLVNNQAEHQLKLTRIEYGQHYSYKKLLTEHFKKHSGNKKFVNINYCYREQRLNTLGGKYITATDSFKLALKDMNNDGIFNESCMDMVYIGGVHDLITTEDMAWVLPELDDIYFEWNKKRYRVKNIEPSGKYIEIQQVENAVLSKQLEVGKKIPKFSFINLQNQKEEIKDYKKKPVYLFFWDEATISDEDTMYLRKIHQELAEEVSVITMNHGDVPRNVRKYQYYNGISWPMAFSSYQIGKLFYIETLNVGLLTEKRLKLRNDQISPKDVYQLFQATK
ncbi:MAG: redoxin domain-containing protein [Bacteroidia bacterium]|nr:redoxin domain-containing protein [Bacteroidia bacterium]